MLPFINLISPQFVTMEKHVAVPSPKPEISSSFPEYLAVPAAEATDTTLETGLSILPCEHSPSSGVNRLS
jgi:hypothetical protein